MELSQIPAINLSSLTSFQSGKVDIYLSNIIDKYVLLGVDHVRKVISKYPSNKCMRIFSWTGI